jgi:hypothetical protein
MEGRKGNQKREVKDGILWRVRLYIMRVWLGRRLAAADGATERGQTLTGESRAQVCCVPTVCIGPVYKTPDRD